uniref:Ras GTPase-activating protein 1-like n=1 Tax=Saccoglossus kowalevskii TaxID=10224 RepID=A0ABM0MC58_SACKO|nr:PREDICTED: ras GTPase-activating protein 1-like [Saccoglossus kowalevskii]
MAANSRGRESFQLSPVHRFSDELQDLTIQDEFDPFEGNSMSFDETVDINLTAPPETEWYHGKLDRATAEERLSVTCRIGSYLIRQSDRHHSSYVLSYLGNTGIHHFKITAVCGDYYIGTCSRQFDSLSGIVSWYSSLSTILKDEMLLYPLPPPDFVKGEVFTVQNELGDGWLWVTSHRTKQSGMVVKDLMEEIDYKVDPNEGKE